MNNYGVDKPDLRFDLKLHNISSLWVFLIFFIW